MRVSRRWVESRFESGHFQKFAVPEVEAVTRLAGLVKGPPASPGTALERLMQGLRLDDGTLDFGPP